MFSIFLMISNYLHDLSVAVLASNILVVYFLGKYLDKNDVKNDIIPAVFKKLSYVTYGALTYVLLGGGLRAFYFMEYEWNPAIGKDQTAALIVKHILLFLLTVFGIIAHMKYQKKYGK